MTLAIVCGMASEAHAIGHPPGAIVIVGAGNAAALSAKLEAAIAAGTDRVISIGLCGALNLGLQVGDVVVGVNAVPVFSLAAVACDPAWCDRLFDRLQANPQPYRVGWGRIAWSGTAVARMADKAALRTATMADVVDEETFLALSIAAAHGLPGAALRVVLDPASFELPPAARIALKANGADDMGAIFREIMGDLGEIPELIQLAEYSHTAMANLRAALARIGPEFA